MKKSFKNFLKKHGKKKGISLAVCAVILGSLAGCSLNETAAGENVSPDKETEYTVGIVNISSDAGALKVRGEPDKDAQVISLLKNGEEVTILAEENGFYRILLEEEDGSAAGYVKEEYVDVDGVQSTVQKQGDKIYSAESKMENIVLLEAADGRGICMVWRKKSHAVPELLSDRYLVEHGYEYTVNETGIREHDHLSDTFTIHDLKSGAVQTVTAKDCQAALPENLEYHGTAGFLEDQGKWYMVGIAPDKSEIDPHWTLEGRWEEQRLLIEMDSGSAAFTAYEDIADKRKKSDTDQEYDRLLEIFWAGYLYGANGFQTEDESASNFLRIENNFYVGSGEVELCLTSDSLPEQNKALYAKFPELRQYRGSDYRVMIHLKGRPDPEELLHLLLEDGQEISYDRVRVEAADSTDGQEHKVDSMEEWDKWYEEG